MSHPLEDSSILHTDEEEEEEDNDEEEEEEMSNDYSSQLIAVDMEDIDRSENDGDPPEEDNQLMIDFEDDNNSFSINSLDKNCDSESEGAYDPLCLVSVGLDDDEDVDEDEEELSFDGEQINDINSKCPFCTKLFTNRQQLNRHIRTVHQKSCSVTCQFCGRILIDDHSYRKHVATVHKIGTSQLQSSNLGKLEDPSIKGSLAPVLSIPSLVKKCPDCDQQFANKTTLNIHRLKVHVAGLTQMPCPKCDQKCNDLTAHMRRAHDVQGIVCPHCANIFSKKCTLNRHIEQVHLNIQIHKPATCPDCGKVFSKKGHLDRHRKIIHQGIKDYSDPCPYCGKVFTTRASLEPHIAMVHEGVRKECPVCNKVLSDLNKHMRTVHGTYRRKAKIPKESIAEIDNPDARVIPKIYGANPAVLSKNIETPTRTIKLKNKIKKPPNETKTNKTPTKKELSIELLRSLSPEEFSEDTKIEDSSPARSTDLIKEELGLSSGITLQKIVKSPPTTKPLPKLTYHGPPPSIPSSSPSIQLSEIIPVKQEIVFPKMVKITGKFAKKRMPDLLPIRKVHGLMKPSN